MSETPENESGEADGDEGVETKYTIPEDHWAEADRDPETDAHPTQYIDSHEVAVYVDDVSNPEDNYDRTKYTVQITYNDGEPTFLYATAHRWKGNYWRDKVDYDWRETPQEVKARVAAVVACDGVDALDPGVRLIDEDGRDRWREIHQPRLESDGQEK